MAIKFKILIFAGFDQTAFIFRLFTIQNRICKPL